MEQTNNLTPPQTPKKVVFLITKSNWGGAQRYVFDLATNLPDSYVPVVVHGGNGVLSTRLKQAGIRTIPLQSLQRDLSLKKELSSIKEIYTILKAEQPSVLHINSSKAGLYGSLLGRLLRVPRVIFTAHGWAFNEDRPYWQRLLLKCLHYVTVISAHHTIAVSHGLKAQLLWPGAQSKMSVVNPGRAPVSLSTKIEAQKEISALLPGEITTNNAALIIGTIAELHPIKRLENAITAVATLRATYPQLHYYIVGDGELAETLRLHIANLKLEQHVFLLGHIDEAAGLLKAFDIFILPSKSESYGYVLLEAAQAEVPIVASDVGGIPDIITHNHSGLLITPDDTPALAAAMARILADEVLRTTMMQAQKQITIEKTIPKMVANTLPFYSLKSSR